MASLFVLIIVMAAIFTTSAMEEATTQFKVGGDLGWRQPDPQNPSFYTQWAESNRFQIGDTLEFVYKNDSVVTVENWDYYNCNASNPNTAFDNGKSIINLDRSGPFYFISGIYDHCINGQRLIVDVLSPHHILPPAASPPSISPAATPHSPSHSHQLGPSPYSSSSPPNSASGSKEVSSSVVLRSDIMAILVGFVVMLLCCCYYY